MELSPYEVTFLDMDQTGMKFTGPVRLTERRGSFLCEKTVHSSELFLVPDLHKVEIPPVGLFSTSRMKKRTEMRKMRTNKKKIVQLGKVIDAWDG